MKRIFSAGMIFVWILPLLFLSACANEKKLGASFMETEDIGVLTDDPSMQEGEGSMQPGAMRITWGYKGSVNNLSNNAYVFQYLNEKFEVYLEPKRASTEAQYSNNQPDICFMSDPLKLYNEGSIRTIPESMIRDYAPDYAVLLDNELYGWSLYQSGQKDQYFGLCTYDVKKNYLGRFSAYRMDWLESLGFSMPGPLVEVSEMGGRHYFSQTPYTLDQWQEIMKAFTFGHPEPDADYVTYGLAAPLSLNGTYELSSLMGALGLNTGLVLEDGITMPYFASETYRDFLTRLVGMVRSGVAYGMTAAQGRGNYSTSNYSRISNTSGGIRIGWNNPSTFGNNSLAYEIGRIGNNFSLLITPPEVNASGEQGAGEAAPATPSGLDGAWVIGSHVSDAKLAKILEMFNAMSFDPEVYVATVYGEEGVDFTWTGEPYLSKINYKQSSEVLQRGVRLINTGIEDGYAGKYLYEFGDNAIMRFAASEDGKQLIRRSYRDDVLGIFALQKQILDRQYLRDLEEASNLFYWSLMQESETDVAGAWDAYVLSLYSNGLQDYLDLYAQYPD